MSIKDDIVIKFYDENKRTTTIAKELKVRPSYVTKIIQKDSRYLIEKENRAKLQEERRKEYKRDWICNKRNSNRELDDFVKSQHNQAIQELSVNNSINNIAFRNWNRSIYRFNARDKTYRLKRNITTGFDVPKKITWQ